MLRIKFVFVRFRGFGFADRAKLEKHWNRNADVEWRRSLEFGVVMERKDGKCPTTLNLQMHTYFNIKI